ncbi:MAG: DUF523 domain-containing protein [Lentisphaeria bacterium]|nr:DUF523 domain-containing protein [Candidatus Neomarinimicrobiota bacterium]MCF7843160.1 DUF523 domain-containing protein [Lentisphaeria bacterium]
MVDKPVILASACLLGEKCRYDGQDNYTATVEHALAGHEVITVCPEVAGGLGVPRPPAEIVGNRVLREDGTDVTAEYEKGVAACVEIAENFSVTQAILKARSPACGCGQIYDGRFNGTLIPGDGLLTRALKAKGVACETEESQHKSK